MFRAIALPILPSPMNPTSMAILLEQVGQILRTIHADKR
jgi:hypothetical protein